MWMNAVSGSTIGTIDAMIEQANGLADAVILLTSGRKIENYAISAFDRCLAGLR